MNLRLDFVTPSPWRVGTVALLALGILLSCVALWQRQQLLGQRDAALAAIEAAQPTRSRARPVSQAPTRKETVEEAQRLVAGLQRPWEPMLNALQSAVRDDVLIQRVQPETDAFRLRIAGQADSSQAFIEFVQRLREDSSWRSVEPLSEARQPEATASGGKPLSFQLTVTWKGQ